jgi:hypothetical protein
MAGLRKCAYCGGKDGRKKEAYETFQAAFDAAQYIEETRGIFLNVYQCPRGNGWHLTKNNAESELVIRKETVFQENNIPLRSPDGFWEYLADAAPEGEKAGRAIGSEKKPGQGKKNKKDAPIVKAACKPGETVRDLSGEIREVIKNVNIEKLFKIDLQNAFCAGMVKNILDGVVHQITVYAGNGENKPLESYTILIQDSVLQGKKIRRGSSIRATITGRSINGISVWRCDTAQSG